MEELKKQSLVSFANNPVMMGAVYDVLLNAYLKKKSGEDINLKGGRFIAIEALQEAWKELEGYRVDSKNEEKASGNIGL